MRLELYDGKRVNCTSCGRMVCAPWKEAFTGGCLWCGAILEIEEMPR